MCPSVEETPGTGTGGLLHTLYREDEFVTENLDKLLQLYSLISSIEGLSVEVDGESAAPGTWSGAVARMLV